MSRLPAVSKSANRITEEFYGSAGVTLRSLELGSQDVIEQMNHRDEIYNLAGEAALHGDVAVVREQTAGEGSTVRFMIERMVVATENHGKAVESLRERRDKRATNGEPVTPFLDKKIQASKDKKLAKHGEVLREREFKETHKRYRKIDVSATRSGGLRNWVGRRIENQQLREQLNDGVIDRSTFDTERATMRVSPNYNWRHAAAVKRKEDERAKQAKKDNEYETPRTPLLSMVRSGVIITKKLHENHKDNAAEREVKRTGKRLNRRVSQPIASRVRSARRSTSKQVIKLTKEKAAYYQGEYRHLRRKRLED